MKSAYLGILTYANGRDIEVYYSYETRIVNSLSITIRVRVEVLQN